MAASFAGAAPPPSSTQLGPLAPYKLADGAPKLLGPSIIDAVYRTTAAAGAGNDSLYIIFSEDLDLIGDPPIPADFNFNGGLASGDVGGLTGGSVVRTGRNLVVMSNFTTPYANGDSVQVAVSGALTGLDGSTQTDVSLIAIRTGPAIYRAELIPTSTTTFPTATCFVSTSRTTSCRGRWPPPIRARTS
jgi:hypothetical protein